MARMKKRVVAGCFAWLASAVLAANLSAQQQVVQFAQASYSADSNPSAVVAADFNGDGIPDLAVANNGANSVSIFLGKGDGTFGARDGAPTLSWDGTKLYFFPKRTDLPGHIFGKSPTRDGTENSDLNLSKRTKLN